MFTLLFTVCEWMMTDLSKPLSLSMSNSNNGSNFLNGLYSIVPLEDAEIPNIKLIGLRFFFAL